MLQLRLAGGAEGFALRAATEVIDFTPLARRWEEGELAPWSRTLIEDIERGFHAERHGDLPRWQAVLDQLPELTPSSVELDRDCVRVGAAADCDREQQVRLEQCLRELHPWRKGPFELFGVHIDTEWRSDWKWSRVSPALESLAGRRVLDVGRGISRPSITCSPWACSTTGAPPSST